MKLAFEITIALKEDRSNRSCFSSTFSASFFLLLFFFFRFSFFFFSCQETKREIDFS